MFCVFFADSLMGYVSPVFIASKMNSTFLMGLILSSSSVVGLLADMVIAKQFARREYRFFVRWLFALALFFPLSFLIMPGHVLTFLVAMAVWGVYYEFIIFSQFNFVHKAVDIEGHARAWGILETFKAFGSVIAPVAATLLLEHSVEAVLYVSIVTLILGMILFFIYRKKFKEKICIEIKPEAVVLQKRDFLQELTIWRVLFAKVWPMYLFYFAFIVMESAFWTVGPLLSEEIRQNYPWSGFLLTAYILPSLFVPYLVRYIGPHVSKKRVAFWSALLGALVLAGGAFGLGPSPLLVICIFLSSVFFSLDYPEIEAVFEDYLSRIDAYSNDLIGLQSTATSLAYIIGPILVWQDC